MRSTLRHIGLSLAATFVVAACAPADPIGDTASGTVMLGADTTQTSPVSSAGEGPAVTMTPQQGTRGMSVELRASGFAPNTPVQVGIGPPDSEYTVIGNATTDVLGAVTTTVMVPDWAQVGREYVFVVAGPDASPKAITGRFMVGATR